MDMTTSGATSWSSAVSNLTALASRGDRNGCLNLIPTLQLNEINTIIDPIHGLTFLHRACQLEEQMIVKSLLQHGADISLQDKSGQTCWTIAIKAGLISILKDMVEFLRPNVPNVLTDLIGSLLPESDVVSLLHELLRNDQSEWVDSSHECVHLCVFLERFEVLQVLLQSGFEQSLRIPNSHGLSPLQVAEIRLIWYCTPEKDRERMRYLMILQAMITP